MKIKIYILICAIFFYVTTNAQMKIGNNSTSINDASLLELETTNQGLVFPRISLTSVSSSSPLPADLLTGTVVYNTNSSVTNGNGTGLYSWNGSAWVAISPNISAAAWGLVGNTGTSASTNFIGTTDAIDFVAKTNNLERLRITSDGNVGIGLANPSYALSVLSTSNPLYLSGVQTTSTLTSDSIVTINAGVIKKTPHSSFTNAFWGLTGNSGTNASTNFIGTKDAIDFVTKTNNLERLRITSGGNVGIGLTNPSYALSVLSISNPLYLSGVQATSTLSSDSVVTINAGVIKKTPYSSFTNAFWGLTGNSGTSASTNFIGTTDAIDFVAKTNNTDRIHILGAANGSSQAGWVGVGVSVPRSSLDVAGNYSNKNVITIQNTSSTGYSSVDMLDNSGTLKGTFGYGNSGTGSFFGSRDYFSTYGSDFVLNANQGNYNFVMSGSTGNIGINTSSPGAALDVNGTFKLGSSGTVLTNVIKGTGSIAAFTTGILGTTTVKTITVTGATTGAAVIVNPQSALSAGVAIAYSYVSGANTVSIAFVSTLASISVSAVTFDVTVIK